MPPVPASLPPQNGTPFSIKTTTASSIITIQPEPPAPFLKPRIYEGSTVPQGYGNSPTGPAPGTVAGIVVGAVAGFLLIWGVIRWSMKMGNNNPRTSREEGSLMTGAGRSSRNAPETVETNSSVLSWQARPKRQHQHRRHHSGSGGGGGRRKRERFEIRRERVAPVPRAVPVSPPPPHHPDDDDMIVVEEFRSRAPSRVRSRPPPPPRTPSPVMRDDGDEIVVLEEEEESPPPPSRRRRDSSMRSRSRVSAERRSVYRDDVYIRDVTPPRD
ncbi:hypothetical protein F5Y17DRAFT_451677 [Xylariaceae sp. FL0594]|nr:hypothetical protein F5Y17DRAFT_451677 [Xylariaceae sp. FL0594]